MTSNEKFIVQFAIYDWTRQEWLDYTGKPITNTQSKLQNRLTEIANGVDANSQLVHKTNDRDEAIEVARQVWKIHQELTDATDHDIIKISMKPYCSACGRFVGWSWDKCPYGGEIVRENYIDFEEDTSHTDHTKQTTGNQGGST